MLGFFVSKKNTLMGFRRVVRHQMDRAQQVDTEDSSDNGAEQHERWWTALVKKKLINLFGSFEKCITFVSHQNY